MIKQKNKLKAIKLFLLSLSLLCTTNHTYAQLIDEKTKTLVIKNIMSYHFRKALPSELSLDEHEILDDKRLFFDELWPDTHYHLDVELEKSPLVYPVHNYELYHLLKRGYEFTNDSTGNSFLYYQFPKFDFDEDYFFAISSDRKATKFISGNFFRSRISSDFKLDKNKPDSFIEYLRWYFLAVNPTNIRYIKKVGSILWFSAYSKYKKEDVTFLVNKNDFDDVKFRYTVKHVNE